jgi:hypothetical protein
MTNEETEAQKKQRKLQKKSKMLQLCRLLDIKDWEKQPHIVKEVREIVDSNPVQKKKETTKEQKK